MKKRLFTLFAFLGLFGLVGCGFAMSRYVAPQSVIAEAEKATITIANIEHGKISVHGEKESYVAGETILLDVQSESLYKLEYVMFNGEELHANEHGELKATLRGGENLIDAKFIVDEAVLGEFSGMYETAKAGDWANLFTPQNLLILVSFLFNSGFVFGLIGVFVKYKNVQSVDRKEIIKEIDKVVPSQAKDIVTVILKEHILPIVAELGAKLDDVTKMCQKFIQAFLYSLEDTMESKEKIIELLSGLNLSDQNTIDELKQWFVGKVEEMEKQAAENKRLLEEMRTSTEQALSDASRILPEEVEQPEKDDSEKVEVEQGDTYDGTSI